MFYAEQFGATLTFVHVMETLMAYYEGFMLAGFEAELQKHIEGEMSSFISEQRETGHSCEAFLLHGPTPEEIVDFAKTNSFDLIIMGSHRYNVVEKFILGSVAEKVAHNASCPVVIYNVKGSVD